VSAKRLLDMFLAVLLMVAASPLFAVAAVGIRLSSPGPILYRATRVGLDGRQFTMHKFRSMTVRPAKSGPAITRPDDLRVFPFGAVLRNTKIDELPQLWDVLRGKMAMVGPRPEDPGIVARHYTERQRKTLSILPGLTSPGALFDYTHGARYLVEDDIERAYVEKLLPIMLEIELVYFENRSLVYDLSVMFRTATTIVRRLAGQRDFPDPPELRQICQQGLPFDADPARSP
jgi:lipopolysaccharide/colanic/teichoic acid biosynthesis glycosyltransferase